MCIVVGVLIYIGESGCPGPGQAGSRPGRVRGAGPALLHTAAGGATNRVRVHAGPGVQHQLRAGVRHQVRRQMRDSLRGPMSGESKIFYLHFTIC